MTTIARCRFELVSIIRQYPGIFYPLIKINNRARGSDWPRYLREDTELVIEGYFRSGNTFAARAFSVAQQRQVEVANHTHAIATLLLAVKRNIPAMVLLRQPADTVISATMKAPGTSLRQHLRWYIRYYEQVYQLRSSLYIALFDEVVQDFGQVIQNVNRRFGTQFTPFNCTKENVAEVLAWIKDIDQRLYGNDISRYSVPLKEKEASKHSLKRQLVLENSELLQRADSLYSAIVGNRFCHEDHPSFNRVPTRSN